jgi:two-component system sensor histidine kinase KdpD
LNTYSEEESREQSVNRFLELIQKSRRGRFKIYIGMSPGVGKTYRMLQEAHNLLKNGINIQIGYVETHQRVETEALAIGLPIIPRKIIFYKGKALEEMDLEKILIIRPEVLIVDELAHSNIPGSKNEKRWQDVVDILNVGINVISAVNIQHIESINQEVERVAGIEVKERIPDSVLALADEVVNIDLTADELIDRLKAGKIYHKSKIERALGNFFQKEKLLQLREYALLEVAKQLDRKIEVEVSKDKKPNNDNILVCISTNYQSAKKLIRKGSRLADLYNSKWFVLYVQRKFEDYARIPLAVQRHLINNLNLATQMGAEVIKINNEDVAEAIVDFARKHEVKMIVLGNREGHWWQNIFRPNILKKILDKSLEEDLDILIIS